MGICKIEEESALVFQITPIQNDVVYKIATQIDTVKPLKTDIP